MILQLKESEHELGMTFIRLCRRSKYSFGGRSHSSQEASDTRRNEVIVMDVAYVRVILRKGLLVSVLDGLFALL